MRILREGTMASRDPWIERKSVSNSGVAASESARLARAPGLRHRGAAG